MEFTDLHDLQSSFMHGNFDLDDNITVSDIEYKLRHSPTTNIVDIFNDDRKGIIVYSRHDKDKQAAKDAGLDEWIMLLWAGNDKAQLVPYDVRVTSKARAVGKGLTEDFATYEKPDNIIGAVVDVKFTSLPGSTPIKAKVDTGADICSLHADQYQINRAEGTITFKSPAVSPNNLTVPLVDQQAVKSADGGSEYRPVIELNIKVGDKLINNVKINLNDRSHMEYPFLVGGNALDSGKFLIDPRIKENNEIDWDILQEQLRNDVIVHTPSKDVQELYTLIKESEVSFADIVRLIRTDVTENVMEELEL